MKIVFLLCPCLVLAACVSYTPSIKGGIAEISKVNIGGTRQSILIRGERRSNPVLLYLHGGPGTTEMTPFRIYQKELEHYFTVAVWEQRGTGKSFSPDIPVESMTIDRFVEDAREVTEYLLREFGKEKIAVAGHSWGSALGLLLVRKYPEYYYVFAGSGQMVNPALGEALGLLFIREQAGGDPKAEAELAALDAPDPYLTIDENGAWYEKVKTQRKWLVKLGGEVFNASDSSLLFNLKTLTAPEYSPVDYINFGRGSVFSLKAMWPQVMQLDFTRDVPEVQVPVFFLQGRHDRNTPASLVEEYYRQLKAPLKELVWFENSGHHPMYEEAAKYTALMVELVLPLCDN